MMMKQHSVKTLMLGAAIVLSVPMLARAADENVTVNSKVEMKDNGGYTIKSTANEVDENGTEKSVKKSEDVDVDSHGYKTKHTRSEQMSDPSGMGNEKKRVTDDKMKEKKSGGYKHSKMSKDTDNAGTDVTTKTETNVDVDSKGNVTKKMKSKKTVDPKGMMNSKTSTSESKTVNGNVVEENKDIPANDR